MVGYLQCVSPKGQMHNLVRIKLFKNRAPIVRAKLPYAFTKK